jgi:hypothetical protein
VARKFLVEISDLPEPWGEGDISGAVYNFVWDYFGDMEVTAQEIKEA